jgi:hypothetical protein
VSKKPPRKRSIPPSSSGESGEHAVSERPSVIQLLSSAPAPPPTIANVDLNALRRTLEAHARLRVGEDMPPREPVRILPMPANITGRAEDEIEEERVSGRKKHKRATNAFVAVPRQGVKSRRKLEGIVHDRGITRYELDEAAESFDQGVLDSHYTRLSSAVVEYLEANGPKIQDVRWCVFPGYQWDARTAAGRELEEGGWAGHTYAYSRDQRMDAQRAAKAAEGEALGRLLSVLCAGAEGGEQYLHLTPKRI